MILKEPVAFLESTYICLWGLFSVVQLLKAQYENFPLSFLLFPAIDSYIFIQNWHSETFSNKCDKQLTQINTVQMPAYTFETT